MHPIKSLIAHQRLFGFGSIGTFVWAKLTRTKPLYSPPPRNLRHPISIRIGTSDRVVYEQIVIEEHYAFDLPFEPETIIDAGANIGLSAVWFANRFPKAKIIAIEPEAANFRMLERNIALYPQVRAVRGALWNRSTMLNLNDGPKGEYSFQVTPAGADSGEVRAYTLPEILAMFGTSTLGLLKIDIEGAEVEVFSDSDFWINRVKCIMVELHDDVKPGCSIAFEQATRKFATEPGRGEILIKINPAHSH